MIVFLKWCVVLFWVFLVASSDQPAEDIQQGNDTGDDQNSHIHLPAGMIKENEIPATCLEDGSYDNVIYCMFCDMEFLRNTITVDSTGHNPMDAVRENEIPATCFSDGSYDSVVYCLNCQDELSREVLTITCPGHTPAEAIIQNEIPPVCKTDGSCETIINCSVCDIELSRQIESIPAIGHEWVDNKCNNCGIAYSVAESLILKLSEDGTYYIISSIGTFSGSELVMPSEYNGLPVKEIADHAFKDCTFVVRAVIPSSIVRLGYGAAEGCTGLEELILEDRSGWSLYDGQEDPKIFPIPAILLINTSVYFDLLIGGDQFALIKDRAK